MKTKYEYAVCGIAFDEDRYIVEWISFHLAIGFEHIFLYDNMSSHPIESFLNPKILLDKVTLIQWPKIPNENAQLNAYRHFLHTYRDRVEWAAIIDLDEFINLKQDLSIKKFLARFPQASAVEINWRIFGSSGKRFYEKIPMIERFKNASSIDFGPNILVKTIHRLSQTKVIHVHYGEYEEGAIVVSADGTAIVANDRIDQFEDNYAVAQINHYFVKSAEEWDLKLKRGYADGTTRSPDLFQVYDRNELNDISILRCASKLRRYMSWVRRSRPAWRIVYEIDIRSVCLKLLRRRVINK